MFSTIYKFVSNILLSPVKKLLSTIWGSVSKKRSFYFSRHKTSFRQEKDITEWTETNTQIQFGAPEFLKEKKHKRKKHK